MKRIEESDLASAWNLIEILKAEGSDITFTDYKSQEELKEWLPDHQHLVYVSTDPETQEVLAIVRGRRENTDQKRHAVFLTAATHPNARGQGLAGKLTNFALEEMKKLGVNIARIYVYSDNTASLAAVSKLGFTHSGTVLRHHRSKDGEAYVDDLIFHKIL